MTDATRRRLMVFLFAMIVGGLFAVAIRAIGEGLAN
jgi:hypothetical protein